MEAGHGESFLGSYSLSWISPFLEIKAMGGKLEGVNPSKVWFFLPQLLYS